MYEAFNQMILTLTIRIILSVVSFITIWYLLPFLYNTRSFDAFCDFLSDDAYIDHKSAATCCRLYHYLILLSLYKFAITDVLTPCMAFNQVILILIMKILLQVVAFITICYVLFAIRGRITLYVAFSQMMLTLTIRILLSVVAFIFICYLFFLQYQTLFDTVCGF